MATQINYASANVPSQMQGAMVAFTLTVAYGKQSDATIEAAELYAEINGYSQFTVKLNAAVKRGVAADKLAAWFSLC